MGERKLGHQLAVGQEHDEVRIRGGERVVGDHDDRLAMLVDGAAQELEHLRRGVRVEVAGRLVGEDQLGPADQRSRTRDPLLLAAGQLARAVRQPVGDLQLTDQVLEPLAVDRRAPEVGRRS